MMLEFGENSAMGSRVGKTGFRAQARPGKLYHTLHVLSIWQNAQKIKLHQNAQKEG
jgi:hypothetical protein